MTNKINGIDVSECPLFDKKAGCYHTFNGECVKDSCALYKWLLELKRLQQENEKLEARLQTLDDEVLTIEITPDEFERYKKYEQALEEIREITEQDRNCMNSELACCGLCEKLDLIKEKINEVLNA